MNSIQLFQKENIGQIRTQVINNEIYLCLKDVCKILGISNSRNVIKRLNNDGVHIVDGVDSLGRKKSNNIYKRK